MHRAVHASFCPRASHPRPSRLSSTARLMTAVTVAAATLLLSVPIFADELVVTINNIKEAGEIHAALYDNAEAFEADRGEKGGAAPGITQGTIEFVEAGSVTYRYDVAQGTYAIGIFHDVNLNNQLDNYFFGVPKEQYGFSHDARGFMGPPSFEAASFEVDGRTDIQISL